MYLCVNVFSDVSYILWYNVIFTYCDILGDRRNYMPPILVSASAKRIATQILVMPKLNRRKDFTLRIFICDIIGSKELPIQS